MHAKMLTNLKYLILTFITAISLQASAHGEDKLGPNGGYIRMPGAFHVEIVPDGTTKFKVFLLDINWKTQAINNSSIEISHKVRKLVKVNCELKEKDFFSCTLPEGADLTKNGKLFVTSQLENQKGNEVIYKLPLKLQKADEAHGSHH
jgi:hypothetical protein